MSELLLVVLSPEQIRTDISTSVEYPDDLVSVFESSEHIHVEQDGEVKTQ